MKRAIIPYQMVALVVLLGCTLFDSGQTGDADPGVRVAFMADVHFHDVFSVFEDGSFAGIPLNTGRETKYATIRTMEAQLSSTRLFNENYFAFLAALDDAVSKGVRIIAFPGDFSDDGQPVHLRGFKKILDYYADEYGIRFFLAPGNHDPNLPFTQDAGKRNFAGNNGRPQPVYSLGHPLCTQLSSDGITGSGEQESHEVICTDEVVESGYEDMLHILGDYGFTPKRDYLYYETPFSSYDYEDYLFDTALAEAQAEHRQYEICQEGSGGVYRENHYSRCLEVMDMSYLVEPAEGLWLLSLDANVYLPRGDADVTAPGNPANFTGSGNAGYNRVVTYKKHLLKWIGEVARQADRHGKTLYAFSHYPAIDFYNGAEPLIEQLWGRGRFQLSRLPSESASRALTRTGLNLHIGGHMHMNNTNRYYDEESQNTLYNIQTPSLAAYVPGYKLLHSRPGHAVVEIRTVMLREVPDFDLLFPLYRLEWDHLKETGKTPLWNQEVLSSPDYYRYTDWHLKELSRLRFLPREWPADLRMMLAGMNGRDMLIASQLDSTLPFRDFSSATQTAESEDRDAWNTARIKAESLATLDGYSLSDFGEWNGTDLSTDFYRLRNAGNLALNDIPGARIGQYSLLARALKKRNITLNAKVSDDAIRFDRLFQARFKTLFEVMHRFSGGLPAKRFKLDLESGEIFDLTAGKQGLSLD